MRRYIATISILLMAVLCIALAIVGPGWSRDNKKISKQDKKGVETVTQQKAEGKTDIRILSEGIDFEGKDCGGGEEDRIEQIPVVLWGKTEPAAVLFLHYIFKLEGGVQEIHQFNKLSLEGKPKTFKEKIREAADDYPISYKIKMKDLMDKEELAGLDAIEPRYVLTADVNGDGVEELIVPRQHGSIDVYDTRKRLFSSSPWTSVGPPKAFTLESVKSHIAVFEDRDVVFYAFNRSLSGELPPEKKKLLPAEGVSAIFQIDHKGIRQIVPHGPGVDWTLRDVRAIGAINYPGSKDIDEIVILHEMEVNQEEDIYLTRMKPDGRVIEKPRVFYQSYSEYGNTRFHFVPESRQTIMRGAEGFYFITPDKPVNWARRVNMPYQYAGIMRGDKGLIVLVRDEMKIFAFDEEGRFYTTDGYGRLRISQAHKPPAYTITVESNLHRVRDFVVNKQAVGKPEYLIIQDREPQMKDAGLTWEKDYWPAAQRFMKEEWIQELRERSQWYVMPESAEEEYLKKYGKKRALPELKDVKEHFPEYYQKFMEKAENKFRGSVVSALTQPLRGSKDVSPYFDGKTNFEDHKDFDGFRKWCEALYIPDELIFTLVTDFKTQKKVRVPGLHRSHGRPSDLKLNMPLAGFRHNANVLNIVAIGRQSGEKKTLWLYIHHEGGLR